MYLAFVLRRQNSVRWFETDFMSVNAESAGCACLVCACLRTPFDGNGYH